MVVHFNRLKLCPTNMRNEVQPSQDSSPDQVVRHPMRMRPQLQCQDQVLEGGAVIVDMDETLRDRSYILGI